MQNSDMTPDQKAELNKQTERERLRIKRQGSEDACLTGAYCDIQGAGSAGTGDAAGVCAVYGERS